MSINLISRERGSHWYLRNGEPFHTVARADGPGERAVTLRDARDNMVYLGTRLLLTDAEGNVRGMKVQ